MHRLNIGVLGPRHSGKTTFLQLLYNELLLELIATDKWKKTFLFVLDLADLASSAQDFIAFYRGIVSATFSHLYWQRPHLRQHYRMIQSVFEAIPSSSKAPPFPKAFARDDQTRHLAAGLANLVNDLNRLWRTPDALVRWLVNVALFPRHIATIFGFNQTVVVFDHFDVVDALLTPEQSPFPDSSGAIWLYDAIKALLIRSSYIIAAHDEARFCGLLPSGTAEVSIDLSETINYCSTVGFLSSDPAETDGFLVQFATDPRLWTITSELCGGTPAFLALWQDLEEAANTVSSEEDELILVATAQEILRMLLRCKGERDSLEVLSCKKRDNSPKSE
jgi:hypothetical protein